VTTDHNSPFLAMAPLVSERFDGFEKKLTSRTTELRRSVQIAE
jgi:hypothetical protein